MNRTNTYGDSIVREHGVSAPRSSRDEDLLATFVQSREIGFAIFDDQLRCQMVNEALARITGVPVEFHLGRTVREIVGDLADDLEPIFRRVLETGRDVSGKEFTARLPFRADPGRWIAHCIPISGSDGNVSTVGAVVLEVPLSSAGQSGEAVTKLRNPYTSREQRPRSNEEALALVLACATEADERRRQAVLNISEALLEEGTLPDLYLEIAAQLRSALNYEFFVLSLASPNTNRMLLRVWGEGEALPDGTEVSSDDCMSGVCAVNQEIVLEGHLSTAPTAGCGSILAGKGMESYCLLPLTGPSRRIGAFGVASRNAYAFTDSETSFLRKFAVAAAAAIEGLMTRELLRQEQSHIEMLLETTKALRSAADVKSAFPAVANAVGKVLSPALIGLTVYDKSTDSFHLHSIEPPELRSLLSPEAIGPFEQTLTATVLAEGKARVMVREEIMRLSSTHAPRLLEHGIEAICSLPLITAGRKLGALNLGSRGRDSFSDRSVSALEQIAGQIAIALDRAHAEREIAELTRRLKTQNIHEISNSRSQPGFSEIIGESSALKVVLNHVATVAPTDSTVLILGETGTGKELIARALHRLSSRREGSFVKLNCAAIPTGLLESELFGHEKGAFTSAVSQKIGRLEMAHKGTLLLDEVGDIPTELQPKLLRVLQDQEFERLGGTRTIRVDVRLIAATNKDLARSVMANEFRSDLYYRLNVFPVTCPALRDRPDDIPVLVRHFVEKYAARMHKQIDHILADTMLALKSWRWPGNVRELENFIERSVILSDGDTLKPPLAELQSCGEKFVEGTLASAEREHILHALRQSGGVISGAQGAAAHLGLKRTTLQSRMQKLGIDRHDYRN